MKRNHLNTKGSNELNQHISLPGPDVFNKSEDEAKDCLRRHKQSWKYLTSQDNIQSVTSLSHHHLPGLSRNVCEQWLIITVCGHCCYVLLVQYKRRRGMD